MFDKTGRDTVAAKVQRFPDGLLVVDGGRLEVEGVRFVDDFLQKVLDNTNGYNAAAEGTSGAAEIAAGANGIVRLDTGTDADKRNIIASMLRFYAERAVVAEFFLKTSTSDADILLFAGLTDSVDEGTGKLPVKDVALLTAMDAWADDFVGFAVRAETSDKIVCVSGKNGVFQSVDSGVLLTLATDLKLRVETDTDGNAQFYINGVLVAKLANAVTPADPLCLYVGGLITAGTTEAHIDLDYWAAYQTRVV